MTLLAAEERLGPYRLVRQIGEGGMARIYLAEHEKLGRTVAIKRLHSTHFDDPIVVARFLAEARAVSDIAHANLIRVHDVVEEPGEIYLVMDFYDGRDVADVLRSEGKFAPQRAAGIAAQLCDVLAAVHARDIIHRDLKPENVFLANEHDEESRPCERVKLLDFGVARTAELRPKELRTRSGLTVGTPTYMSPEQATASAIDARSDLYAVGVLLYEMLTGKPPFTGVYGDVMLKHVHDAPVPVIERVPEVPRWLDGVVMRCLEKSPDDRFQSAAEVATSLRAGTLGEVLATRRRPRRARPGILAIVGVSCIGLLSVLGMALRPRRPAHPPASLNLLKPIEKPRPLPLPGVPPSPPPPVKLPFASLHVSTTPPGARVLIGGTSRCVSPCAIELPATPSTVEIEVSADGYSDEKRTVETAAPPPELRIVLRRSPSPARGTRPADDRNATVDPFNQPL